ncbi:hypothetical protein CesoFtcFv8_015653 [Champsocephalus esox]|uniref:Cytochrome P450 7B1 n=1 Tax=Champsocephalus esox TaxID=159716 RepID=A0AAN8BQ47_9TELE|nr:hypothetical protein CesoFtcFv8_015653 [Champsocephalus esox]
MMMMSPVLLLLLLGLLCFICLRRKRRPGEPPLVSGWIPFLGRALDFGRDAQAFLQEQRRRHGDVFTVHLAGKYLTFILDPLLYPSVVRQGRQLDFHQFADTVAPPTFGYPPVRKGFPGLSEQIIRSFQLMQGEHLGVLTESMMGPERGRRHEGMEDMREDFQRFDRMFPLLIAQVPIGLLGRTRAVRSKLIDRFLPDRMSSWTGTSQLIKTRSKLLEQHASLRDTDKGAHHFAILWASVGNTVPACFWVLYFLLRDPEALQAVRQEVLEVLRQSGGEFSPEKDLALSREQLDSMVLLESSISEGLRLSSASTNIRVSQEDFSLRLDAEHSVSVRKGDVIALYPQSMHMDPDIYQDPQSFRYDRFVQDGRVKTDFYKSGQKLKFFLMPFGSGTSMCPGRYFAVNEIKQFLSLVLLYLDLDLQPGQNRVSLDYGRAGLGILLPNADVRFHYRLRAASQSPAE